MPNNRRNNNDAGDVYYKAYGLEKLVPYYKIFLTRENCENYHRYMRLTNRT